MQKSRPTQNKRARERARQEKQQQKAARRLERSQRATKPSTENGEDSDIAGIVPGPQPSPGRRIGAALPKIERVGDQLVRSPARLVIVRNRHHHQFIGAVLGRDRFEAGANGCRRSDNPAPRSHSQQVRGRRPALLVLQEPQRPFGPVARGSVRRAAAV